MRTITIRIDGCVALPSAKTAGTQGEGGVTRLQLTFDDSWKGLGKRIIWRNARGEDPVVLVLYDPEAGSDTLNYGTRIPAEPLALPGWCSATIEGYTTVSGEVRIARTAELRLEVLMNDGFYAPAAPTDSEVAQIYTLLGKSEENLHTYTAVCSDAAAICTEKRGELDTVTALNKTYADRAKFYADALQHASAAMDELESDMSELQFSMSDKLDKNVGSQYDGWYLTVNQNGDIVPGLLYDGGVITGVCGKTGAVTLTAEDITAMDGGTVAEALDRLAKAGHPEAAGKVWAAAEDGSLTFLPVDKTLTLAGAPAEAAAVGAALQALPVTVDAAGYTVLSGLRKPTALNLRGWSEGGFSVTADGDVTSHYTVTFDDSGRPVRVTDEDGHATAVIWG